MYKEHVPAVIFKWNWMMDWCKSRRLPPGDSIIWEMAEEDYQNVYGTINAKE